MKSVQTSKYKKGGDLMVWEVVKDPEDAMHILRTERPYMGRLDEIEEEILFELETVLKANREGFITRDVENTLFFLLPEPVDSATLWEIIHGMLVRKTLFVLVNEEDQFLAYILLDGELRDDGNSEDSDV
jgi:hypothetical protein